MGHHHGSDTPTSARAILHHTDQKGPNNLHPSVILIKTMKKLRSLFDQWSKVKVAHSCCIYDS